MDRSKKGGTPPKRSKDRGGWEADTLRPLLDRRPERDVEFSTVSGMEIERLYTREDVGSDEQLDARLGFPGEYPFTRGIHPSMYRGRVWTMRQFAGFGSAAQTNERFKYLLEHGQTGLSVAFDLPTLMGRDSSDAWRRERSARKASRSTRWRTWSGCSRASRSTGSRPR